MFKAHRRVYHSTLGWRVIKQKKKLTAISCFQPFPVEAARAAFHQRAQNRPGGRAVSPSRMVEVDALLFRSRRSFISSPLWTP